MRTLVLEDITEQAYRVAMPDRSEHVALAGFLLGASGMFATMYSTQAILPELGQSFGVGPARAGLTVSVLIFSIAIGAWVWGPISDRIGRRRTLITASALLVIPAALAPLAPTFGTLLACRIAQGLCMPGLLTVGVPYVMATFGQRHGARVMGWYVGALVVGGLIGRVGVSLLTAGIGWRGALGAVAVLPLIAAVVMQRSLPLEEKPPTGRPRCASRWRSSRATARCSPRRRWAADSSSASSASSRTPSTACSARRSRSAPPPRA